MNDNTTNVNIYVGNANFHGGQLLFSDANDGNYFGSILNQDNESCMPHPPATPPPYSHVPAASVPQPSRGLTQAIHAKTLDLLAVANEQATTLLGQHGTVLSSHASHSPFASRARHGHIPVAAVPAINVDLSDRSWNMFNSQTHVHHHHAVAQNEDKEQDQSGRRILVGIIGLASAFTAAFFIGKAVAGYEDEQEANVSFDDLKTEWLSNKNLYPDSYRSIVQRICLKMEAINQRHATNRTHKFVLLTLTLIAGGSAFAGALCASKVLMVAAGVIGACTVTAAMFKLGYSYLSKKELKDAEAIEHNLKVLNQLPPLVIYP